LSPVFGLNEIKNEIKAIENAVLSPVFGLNEIKNEIRDIENKVSNLPEVNVTITIINEIVAGINETLNNEAFGLNEIKNEVKVIENTVLSPIFGLNEIKNEVKAIENAVLSPIFGLNEIKNEIRGIENKIGTAAALTTGPVTSAAAAKNLLVKVLNNSQSNQTVQVRVFNLAECPKCNNMIFNEPLGPIPVSCACEIRDIDVKDINEYELEVSGIVPGIYLWSGAAPGGSTNFIAETIFRHVDFVPQVYNQCW
jgi:hypothetical protein